MPRIIHSQPCPFCAGEISITVSATDAPLGLAHSAPACATFDRDAREAAARFAAQEPDITRAVAALASAREPERSN